MRPDNPISTQQDDLIGRAKLAEDFADQLLGLDLNEGAVVGVLGPWGSGKTSFINLARQRLSAASIPILEFNPWMFSGGTSILDSFFTELSAQLRTTPKFKSIGEDLSAYGDAFGDLSWIPIAGSWIEKAAKTAKAVGDILQHKREGAGARRKKLSAELAALTNPIVIIIDDIDRLSAAEIREVFKLVRLTVSFPNIIYVLAFDRIRVEHALAEDGVAGRDYLEKILQLSIEIPTIPTTTLSQTIIDSLNLALERVEGTWEAERWPDILAEIILPLTKNIRDVRRLSAAVRAASTQLRGTVSLCDVVALEAIRLFLPDVFTQLRFAMPALTTTPYDAHHTAQLKPQIDSLIAAAQSQQKTAKAILTRLFPSAERYIRNMNHGSEWKKDWLIARRVAHINILKLYLERTASPELLDLWDAERILVILDDRSKLEDHISGIEPSRREAVLSALSNFKSKFKTKHVVPGVTCILNAISTLPETERGPLSFSPRIMMMVVVRSLLSVIPQQSILNTAVREILSMVAHLADQASLVETVGYSNNAGHQLVSKQDADALVDELRSRIRSAPVEVLIKEQTLPYILKFASTPGDVFVPDNPSLTLAVLRASRTSPTVQTFSSRAIRTLPAELPWQALCSLFESEDQLRLRIDSLRVAKMDGADELVQLADEYLSGKRPRGPIADADPFDDDEQGEDGDVS